MGSIGAKENKTPQSNTFEINVKSKPDEALARVEADNMYVSTSKGGNSWTMKDENGKTRGIIRGIRGLREEGIRVQSQVMTDLRNRGLDRADVMKYYGDFYVRDGKPVYAMNRGYFKDYERVLNKYERERERYKELTTFINKLNDAGVTIVKIRRR